MGWETVSDAAPAVTPPGPTWGSTYRVQLHHDFDFDDLAAVADYLAELGVSHVYCSPYLQAAAGSTHGYDVVDPSRLNEELGGTAAFLRLVDTLRRRGLGQVLDIVPNHMAVDGRDNRWWWDVLTHGPASPYARYFDIDWDSPERKLTGTVLVPVLGDHYGRVIEAGELPIARRGGSFEVCYYQRQWPLSPRTIGGLLARAAARLGAPANEAPENEAPANEAGAVAGADAEEPAVPAAGAAGGADGDELAELAGRFGRLPHALTGDPADRAERHRDSRVLSGRLAQLCDERPGVAEAVDAEVTALNADPDALDELLQGQNYRLAFWRTASEELDYRRFFNIESLVGLRMEDEQVFSDTHGLVVALVASGAVNGLRVDHVDGLRDPETYLHRLHGATGGIPVVVEKILAAREKLPESWRVAGTTGYDFLNHVNALFVDPGHEAELTAGYVAFSGETAPYREVVRTAKRQIMRQELATEVERLTGVLADVCEHHRRYRDYTRRELREGLREVLIAFPVYRTYVRPGAPVRVTDRDVINQAIEQARSRRRDLDPELFDFLGAVLVLEYPGPREAELAAHLQQLTPPVMAKGVEDTAFYRYNRLISLNEVGAEPDLVAAAVQDFHRHNAVAAAQWPNRMITLATHDTKRGPDVRARINVLSEVPGPWHGAVTRWSAHNDRYRHGAFPDRNAEYLLYQTLLGAWPIDAERVWAYMQKATKEAKVHTSWTDPVAEYDRAMEAFVRATLSDEWFVADLVGFMSDHGIVEAGRVNSLSQTALLLSAPGRPDLYQGTELWDYSLVDPDNRRPVDYHLRRDLLAQLRQSGPAAALEHLGDGGAKLWLIHRMLDHRRRRPELYSAESGYQPLTAQGAKDSHVVAFVRGGGLAVVVPRLATGLGDGDWGDTSVNLPQASWVDVLTSAWYPGGPIKATDLFSDFPVAVLAQEAGPAATGPSAQTAP